jgi:hypothetical protein
MLGYLAARHQHRNVGCEVPYDGSDSEQTQNRDGAAIRAKLGRGARGYPCVNANFDSDLS